METVRRMQNKLGKPSKPSSAFAKCRDTQAWPPPDLFQGTFLKLSLKPHLLLPQASQRGELPLPEPGGRCSPFFIIYLLIKRPVIRQIYMQVHTQLCRLGGASAAGNLNKQHHQVALREIDEWKHPGHLQAELAIPPLSSSNPPSRGAHSPSWQNPRPKLLEKAPTAARHIQKKC